MRSPLASLFRANHAPPLRERLDDARARLADTKARAGRALAVAKILMKPEAPKPQPAEWIALVNYATWLDIERRTLCQELYPEAGADSFRFVHMDVSADRFHFSGGRQKAAPASTRAVAILDGLGIDWRADRADSTWSKAPDRTNKESAPLPQGWPHPDAYTLKALADLLCLDAAIAAMLATAEDENDNDPAGYRDLEDNRSAVIDELAEHRAVTLDGLRAKARALLIPTIYEVDLEKMAAIGHSLARDLLGAHHSALEPKPDPIFATIAENRRLNDAWTAALNVPAEAGEIDETSAKKAAREAFTAHSEGPLFEQPPRSAEGCRALARYAIEFYRREGFVLDETDDGAGPGVEHLRILDLIARSPLL